MRFSRYLILVLILTVNQVSRVRRDKSIHLVRLSWLKDSLGGRKKKAQDEAAQDILGCHYAWEPVHARRVNARKAKDKQLARKEARCKTPTRNRVHKSSIDVNGNHTINTSDQDGEVKTYEETRPSPAVTQKGKDRLTASARNFTEPFTIGMTFGKAFLNFEREMRERK